MEFGSALVCGLCIVVDNLQVARSLDDIGSWATAKDSVSFENGERQSDPTPRLTLKSLSECWFTSRMALQRNCMIEATNGLLFFHGSKPSGNNGLVIMATAFKRQ